MQRIVVVVAIALVAGIAFTDPRRARLPEVAAPASFPHPDSATELDMRRAAHYSTFSAIADPTRRAIVARLRGGSLSISALAEPFPISLQAVMKHLDVLAQPGLVTRTKTGRSVTVSLTNEPIDAAAEWLAQHQREWSERLDRLDTYLQRIQHGESNDDKS